MTDPPITNPGHAQPGETPRAHNAFRIYLDLGPGRSTEKVRRALGHRGSTQAERWCTRHRWVERVKLVESAAAASADDARTAELVKAAKLQAREARVHAVASTSIAREVLRRMQTNDQYLHTMSDEDLLRLQARAAMAHNRSVTTERLALGMTTEQQGEKIPLAAAAEQAARLTDEELEERLGGVDLAPTRDRDDA